MFEKNKDKSSSDTNEPAKTDKKKKSSDYIGAEVDFAKSGEVTGIRFLEPLRVNIWLSLLILLMTGFGLLMLFSASIPRGYTDESDPFYYVIRQGGFMLLGILIGAVISMLPIRLFDHIGFVIAVYTMTLGLAVATLFFGNVIITNLTCISVDTRKQLFMNRNILCWCKAKSFFRQDLCKYA